jgi:hypothetical protein
MSVNVMDAGAKGDVITQGTYSMTIEPGSRNLNVSGANFTPADVGKAIIVPKAGNGGSYMSSGIAEVTDRENIVLASAAETVVYEQPGNIDYGTEDTVAVGNAISQANSINRPLDVPGGGTFFINPGHLPPVYVSVNGRDAVFRASNANTPGLPVMTINYRTPPNGVPNDVKAYYFELGFAEFALDEIVTGLITPGVLVGLEILNLIHATVIVPKAVNFDKGIHVNLAPGSTVTESSIRYKADGCGNGMAVDIAHGAFFDAVDVFTGVSFNNTRSILSFQGADASTGATDVRIEFTEMEIPQPNSCGLYMAGGNRGNTVTAYGMRGINGPDGRYIVMTADSTDNVLHLCRYNPAESNISAGNFIHNWRA